MPAAPERLVATFISLDLGTETAVVEGRHPRDHAHQLDRTAAAARTHPHRRDHVVPYWDELLWLAPDVEGLDLSPPDGQELGLASHRRARGLSSGEEPLPRDVIP